MNKTKYLRYKYIIIKIKLFIYVHPVIHTIRQSELSLSMNVVFGLNRYNIVTIVTSTAKFIALRISVQKFLPEKNLTFILNVIILSLY